MIQLIDQNVRLSSTTTRTVLQGRGIRFGTGIFDILIGGLLFIFGLRNYDRLPPIIYLGAGLIACGFYWPASWASTSNPDLQSRSCPPRARPSWGAAT